MSDSTNWPAPQAEAKSAAAPRKLERHVFVCVNRRPDGSLKPDCSRRGGDAVRAEFKRLIAVSELSVKVRANAAGCLDRCESGVTVVVYPEQVWYTGVTKDDVASIVDSHLIGGVPVERLVKG